MFTNDVTVTSS